MALILLLDDDPLGHTAIQRILSGTDHRLVLAKHFDDVLSLLVWEHITLAIISLAAVPDKAVSIFQHTLHQTPDTTILALASKGMNGLTTLLKAESISARHLLAKPIDSAQLLNILNVRLPVPSSQE
jgi:DNA-binding NtrC family response regulator